MHIQIYTCRCLRVSLLAITRIFSKRIIGAERLLWSRSRDDQQITEYTLTRDNGFSEPLVYVLADWRVYADSHFRAISLMTMPSPTYIATIRIRAHIVTAQKSWLRLILACAMKHERKITIRRKDEPWRFIWFTCDFHFSASMPLKIDSAISPTNTPLNNVTHTLVTLPFNRRHFSSRLHYH